MKKKLINFDVFKQLEKNSVSNSARELAESSDILATVLNEAWLDLYSINEDNATFITPNGDFVYANYTVDKNNILLENMEQLVVDKSTTEKNLRGNLERMVDNILEDKMEEAALQFSEYFSTPMLRSELREGTINEAKKAKGKGLPPWLKAHFDKKNKKSSKNGMEDNKEEETHDDDDKKSKGSLKGMKKRHKKKKDHLPKERLKKVGKKMNESKLNSLNVLSNNVLEYLTFKENGNAYESVQIKRDSYGNVASVKLPTAKLRNEGAIIKAQSEKQTRYIQENREVAKNIHRDSNWIRAVNDLKKFNAVSDNASLETAFENVAAAWPELLFLTEGEIAAKINQTLNNSGAANYDDSTCEFLAEGILRTAHKAYTDNVNKICSVAGGVNESNEYSSFSKIASKVLEGTDKNMALESQVFSDLYRGLGEVYRAAERIGDEATRAEAASILSDVEAVLNNEEHDRLRVAEEAALYLQTISEANMDMDGEEWHPSSPHVSNVGSHPQLAKNAAKGDAVPSKNTGPYKRSPFSDGKTVTDDSEEFYTNMKGNNLFPNMENPYAPKPGDFKMHGEKAIENDKEYTKFSGSDVYPSLKNPYLPDHGMTLDDSMRHMKGSE